MDKLRFINSRDLDKTSYDACIIASKDSIVYAHSWYLDAVAENWGAIVLADYKAVMPLAYKRKYGVHYVYMPPFVQRLGIFKHEKVEISTIDFIKVIPKYFLKLDYACQSINNEIAQRFSMTKRQNFVLPLHHDYSIISALYNDALKRNIKFAQKSNCIIEKVGIDFVANTISLFKDAYGKFYSKNMNELCEKAEKLAKISIENGFGSIYNVRSGNEEIVASYFIINDGKRIYYLFGAPNEMGKSLKAIPFLIDQIINEHCNSPKLFDFEGSEIPSVASFYQKFNPETEYYFLWQRWGW